MNLVDLDAERRLRETRARRAAIAYRRLLPVLDRQLQTDRQRMPDVLWHRKVAA